MAISTASHLSDPTLVAAARPGVLFIDVSVVGSKFFLRGSVDGEIVWRIAYDNYRDNPYNLARAAIIATGSKEVLLNADYHFNCGLVKEDIKREAKWFADERPT